MGFEKTSLAKLEVLTTILSIFSFFKIPKFLGQVKISKLVAAFFNATFWLNHLSAKKGREVEGKKLLN